jgi:cysteine desulfurase
LEFEIKISSTIIEGNMPKYYLDHNATTPVRKEVIEEMIPYMEEIYGNASSVHSFGREAKKALDDSREKMASLIGAEPSEIYFTACGTESDNIALAGYMRYLGNSGKSLVSTQVEHSAILKTGAKLQKEGFKVEFTGVDRDGIVDFEELREKSKKAALVSVMHANNETGVIQDIAAIAGIAHENGAVFHTDAVQSAGKVQINVKKMGIDMLSMSAHKLNALKGVGLLYIRTGIMVEPLTYGGSHERGLRPGTENIPGIAGFAKAFELAVNERDSENSFLAGLRDKLEKGIANSVPEVLFNGRKSPRLPGTSNISFPGVDGEALLFSMDMEGIAVSTGSACTSGEVQPSHVLVAMGVEPNVAQSSIRFSMGYGTGEDAVEHVLKVMPQIVERLRKISGKG